jgi:WD40 repeat protein
VLAAMAPAMAPFLHDPLVLTTTVVAGATHQNGAVQRVSVAPDEISAQGGREVAAALPARSVRAYRSSHLVASGGRDGISRVWTVSPSDRADGTPSLRAASLSIQGGLRHGRALSAVEVRSSGKVLTACSTSSTLRVYELEAAHLADARIAEAGMRPPPAAPAASGVREWNYVERVRLQDPQAQPVVVAAKWLDEGMLVEVGYDSADTYADGSPRRVLRAWRVEDGHAAAPHRFAADALKFTRGVPMMTDLSAVSSLATGDGLVAVTYNVADGLTYNSPGYTDVWRVTADDQLLDPLVRLKRHTQPLYASALGEGLLATGGDDRTVRLWSSTALLSLPDTALMSLTDHDRVESLQTLELPGKVWALALQSHLLVVGGALACNEDGAGGRIAVRLFDVADLAAGRGAAVALQTLHVPSISHEWGVRSVATHGGTVVVAGGDDGVVHVWTLAETGKANRPDSARHDVAAAGESSSSEE